MTCTAATHLRYRYSCVLWGRYGSWCSSLHSLFSSQHDSFFSSLGSYPGAHHVFEECGSRKEKYNKRPPRDVPSYLPISPRNDADSKGPSINNRRYLNITHEFVTHSQSPKVQTTLCAYTYEKFSTMPSSASGEQNRNCPPVQWSITNVYL